MNSFQTEGGGGGGVKKQITRYWNGDIETVHAQTVLSYLSGIGLLRTLVLMIKLISLINIFKNFIPCE